MRGILIALVASLPLWVGAGALLASRPPKPQPIVYQSGERNYRITVTGKETIHLRADRIDRRDGCVVFYRSERIDTLICENISGITVTELLE